MTEASAMLDELPPTVTLLAVLRGNDEAPAFLDPKLREELVEAEVKVGDSDAIRQHLDPGEVLPDAKGDGGPATDDPADSSLPYVGLDPTLIFQPTRDYAGEVGGLAVYRGQLAPDPERLEALYVQVCQAHDAITDFRAKLLAALPVLSGAGIALLLKQDGRAHSWALIPAGLFGALITLGLLVHELRGLVVCHTLRARGAQLERALQLPANCPRGFFAGEFDGIKPHSKLRDALPLGNGARGGMIGAVTACWIVYSTVFAGWVSVAVYGVFFRNT